MLTEFYQVVCVHAFRQWANSLWTHATFIHH